MSGRPGWLKVYNQTLDSDFWVDPSPFDTRSAFFYVLLSANWRPHKFQRNGHVRMIERGQMLTSLRKLKEAFHWGSVDRVRRWLRTMEEYGMLTVENLQYGTLLTVVNYSRFQDGPNSNEYSDKYTSEYTHEYSDKYTDTTQSKTIDYIRQKTKDSIFAPAPADAGGRADGGSDAPDQSHDDDDDEEGWHVITAEEVEAVRNGTLYI